MTHLRLVHQRRNCIRNDARSIGISLSDEHQMVYCIAQMRQPCTPKLNPVLVITITGFSDH